MPLQWHPFFWLFHSVFVFIAAGRFTFLGAFFAATVVR